MMSKFYESNTYGMVEVLESDNHKSILIRFVDTGYETRVRYQNLNAGKVVDHPVKAARTAARRKVAADKLNTITRARRAKDRLERGKNSCRPDDMHDGDLFETKKRGIVKVVGYESASHIMVEFVNTGHVIKTNASTLRRYPDLRDPMAISIFGVGRIGVGPHQAHEKGKDTQSFQIWRAMLRRCYYTRPDGYRKWKTYDDCSVCNEWLTFQTFAAWYADNHPNDGGEYQLDKDINEAGNKVYGPHACMFVTRSDNLKARVFKRN